MNEVTLYLVLHGGIVPAAGKSFVGQIDVPLSEEGVEQSMSMRRWLEPMRFNPVSSSDLPPMVWRIAEINSRFSSPAVQI